MIYSWLLLLHGTLRWPVLIVGIVSVLRFRQGSRSGRWTRFDEKLGTLFIGLLDLQLLLGMTLYAVSPVRIAAYLSPRSALANEMGFFAFLHPLLMITAVILAHIGRALSRRANEPIRKQAILFNYLLAALAILAIAVPWWRPLLRF